MLTDLTGDLFSTPGLDALAHGVNCAGRMGKGIAVEFRRRFPMMWHRYRLACATGLLPGDCLSCPETAPRWVYCLATQARPGPCATLPAIKRSVERAIAHAEAFGVRRIGMPRIATGYGGLRWEDVRPIVAQVAALTDVELVVVSLEAA